MRRSAEPTASVTLDSGGYVSLQDDLLIPPPAPLSPVPVQGSKDASQTLPEPQRNGFLSAELHRRFTGIFGASPRQTSSPTKTCSDEDLVFQPRVFFFYGALMDPDALGNVLGLEKTPILTRAKVKGFSTKMWGAFPALVPEDSAETDGMAWKVESEAHFSRLASYETKNYTVCGCEVETDDGDILPDCRLFRWRGDLDSPELKERQDSHGSDANYFKEPLALNMK